MIDMDELYEYENQPCTDMADELEMLEITHEIMAKEKEKTERERKQHVAEGNDTDVYATHRKTLKRNLKKKLKQKVMKRRNNIKIKLAAVAAVLKVMLQ